MEDQQLAVHRTIVVVDVEGFGDQHRTNRNQVAVRAGLYHAMREAFARAGVPWDDCGVEDRGDGVFVLIPADVPKGLLAESLPSALVTALRAHNGAHPGPERIRLRIALHAGEVQYDEHGVTAASVNLAFRLLEASALKATLAGSPGVLAVIVSSWFFEEVVRHTGAAAAYRPVEVVVKETTTTGWICLPDHIDPSGGGTPGGPEWLAGPDERLTGSVPRVWNIPARNPGFTGRDGLLAAVRERLLAGDKAVVQALRGMGGVGKTQLAVEYAHRFAAAYDLAWWVNSEQAGLIGDQFAALGAALGCVVAVSPASQVDDGGAGTEAERAAERAAVLAELRERRRWLLVFDNAEHHADILPWLPGGGGHVLITSRARDWAEVAAPVEVDVLTRHESVAILQNRVTGLDQADADRLADRLGDLPLAIAQAAGFMAGTGMTTVNYLDLLETRAGQLLAQGAPGSSYARSLAAATAMIVDRLAGEDPAAAELASLSAFFAPEPIPPELFTGAASVLPGELAARADDPLAWHQTLAHLAHQSLARIDHRGLQLHKLTQAILRDRLTPAQAATTRKRTEAILAASNPGDPPNPSTWPCWARLMPHILAADLAATDNPELRELACDACWYLIARGEIGICHDLASDLHQRWSNRLGNDHEHTLAIAHYYGWALRAMGRYAEARNLAQDTLDRRRRVLGEDHGDTLRSAHHLAASLRDLGDAQAARALDQDTLERRRRVFGEDDPETLFSANNLAMILRTLGEVPAARNLAQDTLDRKRRVLGEDHPSTLISANTLALNLRALGEVQAARDLDQNTMNRRRRILGEDHPDTLRSATNLAADLRDLGEIQAAYDLDHDTLERRRRVLGEDHPDTLRSATNLAADLRAPGQSGDGL
jgi:Tetratricopeptide repeat/NB-ARC domain